jgi:hypothetical protein
MMSHYVSCFTGLICQHQQSLHDCAQANEYHEQLEQLRQSAVGGELVDAQKQIAPTTTTIRMPIKTE